LWWALLFGGCLGGNITMIGSTANIVALGILEKERDVKIEFLRWLKIGAVVGIVTTMIVWLFLSIFPFYK
jgi:Na+/H+ antiporter NhaD/arsenite permease-like protein